MSPAVPQRPQPPVRDALELWSVAGATGVLRLLSTPRGGVWLVDGRITHAESALTCGVTRLLTVSGRGSPEAYRAAVATGRLSGDVASAFSGISRLELEAVFTSACHSALQQLLGMRGEVRFEMGVRHPLSGVFDTDLRAATDEVDRRRAALDEIWPDDAVDSAPVSPVARIDGQVTSLSALQWEIVVAANRRRTPYDIARLLGRDTYATLLAVRRMVRGGLIAPVAPRLIATTPPKPTPPKSTPPELTPPEPPKAAPPKGAPPKAAPSGAAAPKGEPPARRVNGAKPARIAAKAPGANGHGMTKPRSRSVPRPALEVERLPRREPREVLERPGHEMSGGTITERPAESWTETTLVRIRDALRALR